MNVVSSQALRNAMLLKCVGVAELAKLAGVQASVVSKILRRDSSCRLTTISRLCTALGISPNEIIKE